MIYNENGVEFVSFFSVNAEGFEIGHADGFNSRNPATGGIVVGEEVDISCTRYTYQFKNILEKLGKTIETMPLETLSFYYGFKIGSDSKEEMRLCELKTLLYREGDIGFFRGTYIGRSTMGSNSIDVYTKSDSFEITSIAVNTGEDSFGDWIHTFVNASPTAGPRGNCKVNCRRFEVLQAIAFLGRSVANRREV